jgi:hypothetical protein
MDALPKRFYHSSYLEKIQVLQQKGGLDKPSFSASG